MIKIKNTEEILQSQRDQKIAKERRRRRIETTKTNWYKKSKGLFGFQHSHGRRIDVKYR